MKCNKMELIFCLVLGISGVLNLFASEAARAGKVDPVPLRLVTMNVQCFTGDWQFRLSQILDSFIELSPDVIGLQEVCVDKESKQSQIEFIRNYLVNRPWGKTYGLRGIESQFTHEAWGRYDESLVILTKLEVSAVDKGFLPASLLQRGYVAFLIDGVWYINTHLEYKSENAQARKNQIEFLMGRFAKQNHVIGGDFNSSPDSQDQARLRGEGYLDIFPGDSHLGSDGNSSARIDGFWISPKFRSAISGISSEVFLNKKVQDQYLSDHFAIRADLQLTF
ncbi:MAG: endonuclease/exonuclease/phosphatase family protein [Bdellovibrionaceae bacterium]|nr:endonuclease/exonuclease/phosphatase family protein [Pseudobdellovibrionaceae bacterium]